jgi:DNA-binding GntR family transcriptional regulator
VPALTDAAPPLDLVALPTQRLTDAVYGLLRERILRGAYRPGDRLPVDELARLLGVSQTPVKAALATLAVEGLIQVLPRRGTFVTPLSERDISESLGIRIALELLAAETILEHNADVDVQALRRLASQTAQASEVDEHFRQNAAFHQCLIELSGNRRLAELSRQLNAHIQIALVHSRSTTWRERVPTETQEHAAIIDAIAAGDAGALHTTITRHLQRARGSLLDQMRADSGRTRNED